MRLLLCFAALISCLSVSVQAQETWEQRKANQFKQPLSDQQKQEIVDAVAGFTAETPKKARKILVFYRCEGFIHNSIPYANFAVETLGKSTDAFTVDLADQYDVFTPENLKQYDCILLNNTTGMAFPQPAQMNAFLDFVSTGKGLVGIHAASDNFGRHPECRSVVGGEFGGHPWNAGGRWAFKVDDPEHVLNRSFAGKGFWHTDEIYQYKPETYVGPKVLRLLVSLDMNQDEVSKQIKDGPREVPVSWLRKAGDGRVFYTNFGHREDTFKNSMILKHMLDGIQYALGDLEADATPTADAGTKTPSLAPAK